MLSLRQSIKGSGKAFVRDNGIIKRLLFCGIASSLWYIVINIIVPMEYAGYRLTSQTVSELSAIDAPTRILWVALCIFYSLLLIAFGVGLWFFARNNKKLQIVAVLFIFDGFFGFFWPPMHQREVLEAGGGTLTDTFHLAWAYVTLALMLSKISLGAAALGRQFKVYSLFTVLVFVVFGMLTGLEAPGIESGDPTPYIGIWERINIGAYMVWVMVFAFTLLQKFGQKLHR
jgi:hypothetical protein